MDVPVYLRYLRALSLNGRATRSYVEIERVLAVCHNNECGQWTDAGCRRWCGREEWTSWPFAMLLADTNRRCERWGKMANSPPCNL